MKKIITAVISCVVLFLGLLWGGFSVLYNRQDTQEMQTRDLRRQSALQRQDWEAKEFFAESGSYPEAKCIPDEINDELPLTLGSVANCRGYVYYPATNGTDFIVFTRVELAENVNMDCSAITQYAGNATIPPQTTSENLAPADWCMASNYL